MLGKEISMKEKRLKKSKRKRLIKYLICSNISFLLSVTVAILALLLVVRFSCFSRNSLYMNMRRNNYYVSLQEEVHKKAQTITLSTGLPIEIINGTMDLYQINRDVKGYIESNFKEKNFLIDTSGIENNIETNIRNYFIAENIVPTIEQNANMKLYIDSISELYSNSIKPHLLESYFYGRSIYLQIFRIGVGISIPVILLLLFLLLKMNPWLHRAFRYITYSITASALMIVIIPAMLLYYEEYLKINLKPEYMYQFIISFISNILETFIKFGIGLGFVAIILLIIMKQIKLRLVLK
jgi:hypothetical protein